MYRTLKTHLSHPCSALVDVLYPRRCIACGRSTTDPLNILCTYCLVQLPRVRAIDVTLAIEGGVPTAGRLTRLNGLWLYNAGSITGHIQKQLKYGNRPGLGWGLGRMMGRVVARDLEQTGNPEPDVVVPVPLSKVRYLERGYNQALYLARGVGASLSVPVKTVIRKKSGVRSQTGLSRPERMLNLESAFGMMRNRSAKGKTILIVDDVWTTGATVCSVADTLLNAGASSVQAVVMAITLHS